MTEPAPRTAAGERALVPCSDPACRLPCAVVLCDPQDGLVIEIQHQHHGKRHVSRLTLAELAAMVEAELRLNAR